MGDKSQLVCMTLAARHRHWPVLVGATAGFLVLNTLAVVFGAGFSHWVPERILAGIVAILFAVFGILSLRAEAEDEDETIMERSGHGIFITAFLMIFLAEMGDKTQIAVAGMASTLPVIPVWIGATLALIYHISLGRSGRAKTSTAHPTSPSPPSQRYFFPDPRCVCTDQGLLMADSDLRNGVSTRPGVASDFRLLRHLQSVIHLDSEVPDRALQPMDCGT